MHRIDGEGATPDLRFTEGNPITGAVPTVVTAGWLNDMQENVMRCLAEGGISPSKGRDLDLWDAIMTGATQLIEQVLQDFDYVQDGGNVTGTIKGGKFTLNAPQGPSIPPILAPSGGNVTGTIDILAGTFTLNAEGAGGGGGEGPAIEDGIVAVGTGSSIRAARDGDKSVGWNGGELGVSGRISVGNGFIRSSVYAGQPMGNAANGLFLATLEGDGDAGAYFFKGATNSTAANVGGIRKFAVDTLGTGFLTNTVLQSADYAEWFEGAPDLPPGVSVVIDEDGVRPFDPARDRPSHIIGITRPRDTRAALIGNAAEDHWAHLYLTDAFGAPVWEEGWGADGEPYRRRAVNPLYDPAQRYVPRSARPEWSLVGLLGQIPIRAGQPVHPHWRLIRALSATVNLYLVR